MSNHNQHPRQRLKEIVLRAALPRLVISAVAGFFLSGTGGCETHDYRAPHVEHSIATPMPPILPPRIVENPAIGRPIAPPAPLDSAFARALANAHAESGEVEVALTWGDKSDLDLWCIEPRGSFICFARNQSGTVNHTVSPSGGKLDVDMNRGPEDLRPNPEHPDPPVEHIRWIANTPHGKYQVYVGCYDNHGEPLHTPFTVNFKVGSERRTITGTAPLPNKLVAVQDPRTVMTLVGEFEVRPKIRLSAPEEMQLTTGAANHMTVYIARDFMNEEVTIHLSGDVNGLSNGLFAHDVIIPPGQTSGDIKVEASSEAPTGTRAITVTATGGGAKVEQACRVHVAPARPSTAP